MAAIGSHWCLITGSRAFETGETRGIRGDTGGVCRGWGVGATLALGAGVRAGLREVVGGIPPL